MGERNSTEVAERDEAARAGALRGALLVSVPKAGTHLVLAAMVRLGYSEYGWGHVSPREERGSLYEKAKASEALTSLLNSFPFLQPESLSRFLAVEVLARVQPPTARLDRESLPEYHVPELARAVSRLVNRQLFPVGIVAAVHELWHDEYSLGFLADWSESDCPRIVFNYRDPRDQLVSMVNFLTDSRVAGKLGRVYAPILRSFGTFAERLSYAIECPMLPFRDVYRHNAWMLHHPQILKIRFEDLVGREGGGSAEAQRLSIAGLAEFVGVEADTAAVAQQLHGGTKTFRTGRQNGWADVFSDAHRRAFEREFGDVLKAYGYV